MYSGSMSGIDRLLKKIDKYQQQHRLFGFLYAVLKKYGDDQAGNQAALITYYGFLSLFPLLLIFFTIIRLGFHHNIVLQQKIIESSLKYFPVVGQQLQNSIHASHRTGLSLVIEILIFLYGARGVASALQNACNHIWGVPLKDRPDFVHSLGRSIGLLLFGGVSLVLTTSGISYATTIGHGVYLLKTILVILSLGLNIGVFLLAFRLATAKVVKTKNLILGSIVTAVFWQILQIFGSLLVLHQFREASALYGTFALVLGVLFWFYLQAEITLYAIEINVVRIKKLWPRSFFEPSQSSTGKTN